MQIKCFFGFHEWEMVGSVPSKYMGICKYCRKVYINRDEPGFNELADFRWRE
jgi:hypothetical protein